MKGVEGQFSAEMEDFLVRLGFSKGNAPESWTTLWELSKATEGNVQLANLHPTTYQAIKSEITRMQHVRIGRMTVGAIYLLPGHRVEVEDHTVDLAAYLHEEKKAFYGFRMGDDVLYYVATNPLGIDWSRDGVTLLFKARAVLGNLVQGNLRSYYLPYLPESIVVGSAAKNFGLKWARSLHEEYYYGDQRFRYVSIEGQFSDPRLGLRVFLFDKQESVDWLRSQSRQFSEDERTDYKRIVYSLQGRKLLVLKEDLTLNEKVESHYAIESCLANLSETLREVEYDLSAISIGSVHKVDPDFEWRSMLGRI